MKSVKVKDLPKLGSGANRDVFLGRFFMIAKAKKRAILTMNETNGELNCLYTVSNDDHQVVGAGSPPMPHPNSVLILSTKDGSIFSASGEELF